MTDELLDKIITKDRKKKFGSTFCIPLSAYNDNERGIVKTFPSWDCALGGGFLRGQTIHVHAVKKIGKTTFCFQIAQKFKEQFPNTIIFYYKVENRLSSHLLDKIDGFDRDRFFAIQSGEDKILTGVDYLQILESNIKDFPESVHIFDSIGGLIGQKEAESEIGDCQVAEVARLIQFTLKKISPLLPIRKATVFFINHEKREINTTGYGSPRIKTPGGTHLGYQEDTVIRLTYASGKSDGASKDIVDSNGEKIGHNVCFNVETTIMGKPNQKVVLPFMYDNNGKAGYDYFQDIFNFAKKMGIIEQAAAWFYYGDKKTCGLDNFLTELKNDKKMFKEIEGKVWQCVDGLK